MTVLLTDQNYTHGSLYVVSSKKKPHKQVMVINSHIEIMVKEKVTQKHNNIYAFITKGTKLELITGYKI